MVIKRTAVAEERPDEGPQVVLGNELFKPLAMGLPGDCCNQGKATRAAKARTVSGRMAHVTRSMLRSNSRMACHNDAQGRPVETSLPAAGGGFMIKRKSPAKRQATAGRSAPWPTPPSPNRRPNRALTRQESGSNASRDGLSPRRQPAGNRFREVLQPLRQPRPLANSAITSTVMSVRAESTVAARAETVKMTFNVVISPAQRPTSGEKSRRANRYVASAVAMARIAAGRRAANSLTPRVLKLPIISQNIKGGLSKKTLALNVGTIQSPRALISRAIEA